MTQDPSAEQAQNRHAKKAEHLLSIGHMRPPSDEVISARASAFAMLAIAEELAEMNRLTGELLT